MSLIVATEEHYLRSILNGQCAIPALLRLGVLDDEYVILSRDYPNAASTQSMVLHSLLQSRCLVVADLADINMHHGVNLESVRTEYLGLSLRFNRAFVHDCGLSDDDKTKFSTCGVSVMSKEEIQTAGVFCEFQTNVAKSWDLVLGGNLKLSECLCEPMRYSKDILIYDRYFGSGSLSALVEAFGEYHRRYGIYEGRLRLYHGASLKSGLNDAAVRSSLSNFLDASKVFISRSDKRSGDNTHSHDRYVQIDRTYTLQLTAGLDCFVAEDGKNRSCSVLLRSLAAGYRSLYIIDSSGAEVRVDY